MAERIALLPPQASTLETAVALATDCTGDIEPGVIALRDWKDNPPASVVPFLIIEYGLEEIEEFFPIGSLALSEGLIWRRLVGTPEAVRRALVWIGYRASIEDQWIGRRRWHTFQFRFPELPGADAPDLARVAKIAEISTPLRSQFRRGVFQYDVGPLDADNSRLDGAMLERESGHALDADGPLWSFGRTHEIAHLYSEADGLALGNWIAPVSGTPLRWLDLTFPWDAATFPWDADGETQRRTLLSGWFAGKTLYACLKNGAGDVIGYRRCRAAHPVRVRIGGPYTFAGTAYEPSASGEQLYIEALTDFGSVSGLAATSVALVAGAAPVPGVPPGKLWLAPGELIGGTAFAETPIAIPLRATVRDQIKFLVRF